MSVLPQARARYPSNRSRGSPKLICLDAGQEDGGIRACECIRHEFAVHSLKRDRHEGLAQTFALVGDVFEEAVGDRGRALHNYLLGLNFRIRATAPDFAEIAADVSALTGAEVTAADLT